MLNRLKPLKEMIDKAICNRLPTWDTGSSERRPRTRFSDFLFEWSLDQSAIDALLNPGIAEAMSTATVEALCFMFRSLCQKEPIEDEDA